MTKYIIFALLPPLMLCACGDDEATHGQLTSDEQAELDRAAEMLDSRGEDAGDAKKEGEGGGDAAANPTKLTVPFESE